MPLRIQNHCVEAALFISFHNEVKNHYIYTLESDKK